MKRRSFAVVLCILVSACSVQPVPLTREQVELIAINDRQQMFANQEAVESPLTLERAMAMALKYNLENRVRLLEEAVAYRAYDVTKLDMLPQLAANAGYTYREQTNASFSTSVDSGNVSLEPSTSQDKEQHNADFGFTWNLLDFGVSYIQAKQEANRYLMAGKAREKVMLTLLQEVRTAYWNAVAMEAMKSELQETSARVETMLTNLQTVRKEQLRTPVSVLLDIRALVETSQQLDQIQNAINNAETRLATLVNVPNYNRLDVPVPASLPELVKVSGDIESMEILALANSSDYTSEIYKLRIEQLETRKSLVQLLPGIDFSYTDNYNSNSFLVNNQWNQAGSALSGDLMPLFFTNRFTGLRDTSEQLAETRKLAVNMAVVAGVHITWQDYQNSLKSLERARLLNEIDAEISTLTQGAQASQAGSGVDTIQNELRAFRSKISQMQNYADAQGTFGSLLVSLGLNPIPANYSEYSVDELARALGQGFSQVVEPLRQGAQVPLASFINAADTRDAETTAEVDAAAPAEIKIEEAPPTPTEFQSEFETALAPPPDAESFRRPFVQRTDAPAVEAYLQAFLDKLRSSPGLEQYLDDFLDGMQGVPDMSEYLQEFLKQMEDAPVLNDFVDEFKGFNP